MIKKLIPWICVIIVTLFTIRPLFSSGFFPMHDDAQVARVIEMTKALKNGQFPVRIVSDLGYGYGYPLFNFYGPLPYYIGGGINALGLDALTATKIMIGIGVVMGSIGMYILSSSIFGAFGGILSATLFAYFPYRAVQLYVRGAVGEIWAISFLPLVFFGFFLVSQKNKQRIGIFVTGFSLAGIIVSHTVFGYVVTGSMALVVLLTFLISLQKKKRTIRSFIPPLIAICAIALGLTAFFWLPAIAEMSYVNVQKVIGDTAKYKNHYICFLQLWDSPWGFGGSAPGCLDGISFKLGKLHIIVFIAALFMRFFSKEKGKRIHFILMGTAILSGLLLFLTLQISRPVWEIIPFFPFVQYPWRFLGPLGVCIALISGYVLYKRKSLISIISLFILGGGSILINAKLFTPQYLYSSPAESFTNLEELRWRASKVSDEYLPQGIKIPETVSRVVQERVTGNEFTNVKKIWETETGGKYQVEAYKKQELKLNMAFFPGWTFFVNGDEVKPKVVQGQPYVVLSTGINLVEMRFSDTFVREIGNGLTLITIIGMAVIFIYGKKNIRNYRHTRI
ncbi:TPA: hypothetical protein DIS60_02565 [Patescibacteria group bacterium]|nr:hypothetical protein [Patescibacteria group bacterium]